MKKSLWSKTAAAAGILLLLAAGYFLIVRDIFKVDAADHRVYFLGLLSAGVLWLTLLGMRERLRAWLVKWLAAENRLVCVRIALFALIHLLSMYYFNSGSNRGHRIATRGMLICFALILMSFYELRGLASRGNALYASLCAAVFAVYALTGRIEEGKGLQYALNLAVAVLWGVLILRLLWSIQKGEGRRLCRGYAVALFGFFALLILFRNTRGWTFTAAVPFTVLYLQGRTEEEWKGLTGEFINGALLSFFLILGFSLLFRPYHRYNFFRYPLSFASVATCSLYLLVVFGAAFVKYLEGFHKSGSFRDSLFSLLAAGTVLCYTFMTISRTAFLAIAAAAVTVLFLLGFTWYKDGVSRLLLQLLCLPLAAAFIFPLAFTATRSIPALVGKPFIMGGERWEETILETDPPDSEKYMNMKRFGDITVEKLLDTFKIKDEIGGIQETGSVLPGRLTACAGGLPRAALIAPDAAPGNWYNEGADTASNGRFEIYLAYLDRLNLTGHDTMVVETDELIYYHAHNTFLQTAYDHGVIVGIYFILLGIVSFIVSIRRFAQGGPDNAFLLFPAVIIVLFGAASLTEWTFHPSIMLGFALLFVQAPLLGGRKEENR